MIKNSVGTDLFKNLFVLKDGESIDILDGGDLSCSFFVSGVLSYFNLVKAPHATVSGLVRDLEESGWTKTEKPKEGDIVVWEAQAQTGDELHKHVGFYISEREAISNSFIKKVPALHHITFEDTRKVEVLYTNSIIN